MAQVNYSRFLPEILAECDACPDSVAVLAIRTALVEFCTRTEAWFADVTIPMIAATLTYDLTAQLPVGSQVFSPSEPLLVNKETPIFGTSRQQLDATTPSWEAQTNDTPSTFYMSDTNVLRPVPVPSTVTTASISGHMILRPTETAVTVDQHIYDRYRDTVCAGARSKLMGQRKKPWTDDAGFLLNRRMFNKGISDVMFDVRRERTRMPSAVQMVRFGV